MSTGRKTDRGLDDQGKQIHIFRARAPRHSSSEMCPKEREHCFWQLSISESPSVEENKARGDDKSACAHAQALTCCTHARARTHTHTHTQTRKYECQPAAPSHPNKVGVPQPHVLGPFRRTHLLWADSYILVEFIWERGPFILDIL